MFLRRNVAGQTFRISGSLINRLTGEAITSGASIRIGTSAGAGTLSHDTDGAWDYTPTQAETDVEFFRYTLSATNARSICGTLRTTNANPNDAAALGLTRLDAAVTTRSTFNPASDAVATVTNVTNAVTVTGTPSVNVTQFGGVAGTFASGRPEVNTTHWAGTAVGSANVRANLIQIGGAAVSTSSAQLGVNVVQWGATAVGSANVRANVVQVAGQTASAAGAVTFPGSIGTSTLDAAGVRTAVGLASANLDTQLAGPLAANVVEWLGVEPDPLDAGKVPTAGGGATPQEVWEYASRTLTGFGFGVTVSGYATGQSPADLVDLSGLSTFDPTTDPVLLNLAQTGIVFRNVSAVTEANVTVADCLAGAFVLAAGPEEIVGTAYIRKRPNNSTYRAFDLDDADSPTSRS